MAITKVWLEESDCISCEACESNCPEVFAMEEGECIVKPEAGEATVLAEKTEEIKEAADACPVDCIKFEEN